jgi:hypothetical protein
LPINNSPLISLEKFVILISSSLSSLSSLIFGERGKINRELETIASSFHPLFFSFFHFKFSRLKPIHLGGTLQGRSSRLKTQSLKIEWVLTPGLHCLHQRQVILHLGLPTLFSRCREVPYAFRFS